MSQKNCKVLHLDTYVPLSRKLFVLKIVFTPIKPPYALKYVIYILLVLRFSCLIRCTDMN